jgi:hypothetical protein
MHKCANAGFRFCFLCFQFHYFTVYILKREEDVPDSITDVSFLANILFYLF